MFYKMFKEVEEIHGTLVELVVKLIRAELDDLQKKTVIFGSFNKDIEINGLNFEKNRELV